MSIPSAFGLFEAFGVELEYALVDADTLDVLPVADELLRAATGKYDCDFFAGPITWSNELVAHVIELKVSQPVKLTSGLVASFDQEVAGVNRLLAPLGGRLLPTAMHPWMGPRQARLWPHAGREVYEAYDRIFDCRRHGWANLQSVHLNLPFDGDEEFSRLHAAVRLVLPILPALAASSPVVGHRVTGWQDTRIEVYRSNSHAVPSLTGRVIPEPVFSEEEYRRVILDRIYADILPHDGAGVLRGEFLNARGAIARFDRGSIEIRLLDVQECPRADLAVCAAVAAVLEALVGERWASAASQRAWPIDRLEPILLATAREGEQAVIGDAEYLRSLGLRPEQGLYSAGAVWRHLIDATLAPQTDSGTWAASLELILSSGPVARRILAALGEPSQGEEVEAGRLGRVYRQLCSCLATGDFFRSESTL